MRIAIGFGSGQLSCFRTHGTTGTGQTRGVGRRRTLFSSDEWAGAFERAGGLGLFSG